MTKGNVITYLFLLLFLIGYNPIKAQNDTIQNNSVLWSEVKAFTPTIVKLPDNYDSTKKYTLVIGLHGFGDTAESFQSLGKAFTEAGFIYAVPEAPYSYLRSDGTIGYEWFLYDISTYIMLERPASKMEKAAMRVTSENQMGQVIKDLKNNYNVDKIYLTGFSQGGIITYLAGIHHHDKIDGMIIFSSVVDADWLGNDNIEDGKGVRTLIIQGEQDKLVPIELAENGRDLLIENGYNVTYKKFEGKHIVPMHLMDFVIDWINRE